MSVQRMLQSAYRFSSLTMSLSRMSAISGVHATRPVFSLQKQPVVFISTSKKNRDTTITADQAAAPVPPKTVEDFANPDKKNFQHYGFIADDQEMDINIRNFVMFVSVTVGMVVVGFILCYFPDVRLKDWCSREGYIELARREALGLPLVDPDLVPPENLVLPTDEELGDYDIII